MKTLNIILTVLTLLLLTAACEEVIRESGDNLQSGEVTVDAENSEYFEMTIEDALSENCSIHEESSDYVWKASEAIKIYLNGNSITSPGSGVIISGSNATITSAGTYEVSGTLTAGQIIINTEDEGVVKLVLNGADITCSESSAIYIENSPKTTIVLADNTENKLTDAANYTGLTAEEDEPNAAVFSKDDLTIEGSGSLTVKANYNNGIQGKDDRSIHPPRIEFAYGPLPSIIISQRRVR